MHIYFDESGDFAFPSDRFDAYVQAALICPTSLIDKIEHYVENAKSRLGVDELHATTLPDEELIEICRFIVGGTIALIAQVTDTDVMTQQQLPRIVLNRRPSLSRTFPTISRQTERGRGP